MDPRRTVQGLDAQYGESEDPRSDHATLHLCEWRLALAAVCYCAMIGLLVVVAFALLPSNNLNVHRDWPVWRTGQGSGQPEVRYITRPKSETMRVTVTRQLQVGLTPRYRRA